ncbi:MAG: hypothetical protein ACE5GX_13760 [Thermoanaerobaculia bacterium]
MLTDEGDIAGFSSKFAEGLDSQVRYRRLPVLNLRGRGWIDLSKTDDRLWQLTSVELEVLRLNRFGDFVMPRPRSSTS